MRRMKLIRLFLLVGMSAMSGWAQYEHAPATYSTELWLKAEAGDAVAQANLGACYIFGTGVIQDKKEGVKWYKKSSEPRCVLRKWHRCYPRLQRSGKVAHQGGGAGTSGRTIQSWYALQPGLWRYSRLQRSGKVV